MAMIGLLQQISVIFLVSFSINSNLTTGNIINLKLYLKIQ